MGLIKKAIIKVICPDYYELQKENSKIESIFIDIMKANRALTDCLDHINKSVQDGLQYVSIKTNKKNERVAIYKSILSEKKIELYLYSLDIINIPKVCYAEVEICDEHRMSLGWISVTQDSYYRNGYGSLAIEEIFSLAKKHKINLITGTLHWERRHYLKKFYEKNGFTVEINEEKKIGKFFISLN